jgi:hypothetical protein
MSWSIGVKTNELVVSKACFEELKVWAEDEGHYRFKGGSCVYLKPEIKMVESGPA